MLRENYEEFIILPIRSAISETIYCIEVFMTTRHALSIYTGLNEMILELSETVNSKVAQYD